MFIPYFPIPHPNQLTIPHSGLNVVAFVMIFFFVPETKQRTLEELDYIFAVPLSKFISYQTGTWLPWWFQRYILRKKVQLTPLYQFERGVKRDLRDVDGEPEGGVKA